MGFTWHYLYIFLQSNLLEVPIYYLFYRHSQNFYRSTVSTTVMNSMTHPLVYFGFMNLSMTYLNKIILAEGFAIISETFFYHRYLKINMKYTFFAALIANVASWQFAPILTYLLFR